MWEQLAFLSGTVICNVLSGIVVNPPFSFTILFEKLKQKGIYYGLALITIHCFGYFTVNDVPLENSGVEIFGQKLNVVSSFKWLAVAYMAGFEVLSTNDNLHQKYGRWVIPPFIASKLRLYIFPSSAGRPDA